MALLDIAYNAVIDQVNKEGADALLTLIMINSICFWLP